MHRLVAYFQNLTLKELLALLFFSFAIVLNALSAIFDFAFERIPFAITQSVSVMFNSLLLLHYLKFNNLRFATVGLSVVYSIEFLIILYFEHFALHGYFFPLFLPLIAYLTLSIKESTIITFLHYSGIVLLSIYAYTVLHIKSQAFTSDAIIAYALGTLFIILFGLYYHVRIADDYYKLFNSNYQKEIALDEIHHRVRNNLTVINSMLGTQMMTYDKKDIQAIIDKNRTRIETIAKIHDILYNNKNEAQTIKFEQYIDELTDYLLSLTEIPIKVKMKIDTFYLPMPVMHKFGIIIHELVTNSIKYAFEAKSNNIITISLQQEGEELLFEYNDNGKGCHKKEENCQKLTTEENSLGLELIALSVKQINGKLHIESNHGMKVQIRFPLSLSNPDLTLSQ